MQPRTWL